MQKKGQKRWTKEEDAIIIELVKKYGTKDWTGLSKQLNLNFKQIKRTGKQCRQRYHNHLNPEIQRKQWNEIEESIMFEKHKIYGNKWAAIAAHLQGRTDNHVKNHFYSTIRRSLRRMGKLSGSKNSTRKMKQIKPSVLSKIFQININPKQESQIEQRKKKCSQMKSYVQLLQYIKQNLQDLTDVICELSKKDKKPLKNLSSLSENQKQQYSSVLVKLQKLNQIYLRYKKEQKQLYKLQPIKSEDIPQQQSAQSSEQQQKQQIENNKENVKNSQELNIKNSQELNVKNPQELNFKNPQELKRKHKQQNVKMQQEQLQYKLEYKKISVVDAINIINKNQNKIKLEKKNQNVEKGKKTKKIKKPNKKYVKKSNVLKDDKKIITTNTIVFQGKRNNQMNKIVDNIIIEKQHNKIEQQKYQNIIKLNQNQNQHYLHNQQQQYPIAHLNNIFQHTQINGLQNLALLQYHHNVISRSMKSDIKSELNSQKNQLLQQYQSSGGGTQSFDINLRNQLGGVSVTSNFFNYSNQLSYNSNNSQNSYYRYSITEQIQRMPPNYMICFSIDGQRDFIRQKIMQRNNNIQPSLQKSSIYYSGHR